MVVSFGRANFRLELRSVELALEAVLGARGALLQVVRLADRVFRFAVCSKHVGLDVLKVSVVSNQSFLCFFHLWSSDGPNWRRDYALWLSESEADWSLVLRAKRCSANALQAMAIGDKLGTHSIVKKRSTPRRPRPARLRFADCIAYEACLGYAKPSGDPSQLIIAEFLFQISPQRLSSPASVRPAPLRFGMARKSTATVTFGSDVSLAGSPMGAVACVRPGQDVPCAVSPALGSPFPPGHDDLPSVDPDCSDMMTLSPPSRSVIGAAPCMRPGLFPRIYDNGLDPACNLGSRPARPFYASRCIGSGLARLLSGTRCQRLFGRQAPSLRCATPGPWTVPDPPTLCSLPHLVTLDPHALLLAPSGRVSTPVCTTSSLLGRFISRPPKPPSFASPSRRSRWFSSSPQWRTSSSTPLAGSRRASTGLMEGRSRTRRRCSTSANLPATTTTSMLLRWLTCLTRTWRSRFARTHSMR